MRPYDLYGFQNILWILNFYLFHTISFDSIGRKGSHAPIGFPWIPYEFYGFHMISMDSIGLDASRSSSIRHPLHSSTLLLRHLGGAVALRARATFDVFSG